MELSTSDDFESFDFSQSVRQVSRGLVVTPILHNYLYDAAFPDFSLRFRKQEMERRPDGFFHPSTHPQWDARALYRYIAHPDRFPVDRKQYMSTLAVMMGKIWHEFVQVCLGHAGFLPADLQVCETCPPEADCHEASFLDEDLGERGHCDGLLDLSRLRHVRDPSPVLEIKTANDNFGRLSKVEDLDLDTFRARWPAYWDQQQRYLKQFRRTLSIVVMIEPTYPYVMREFHVPIDYAHVAEVDAKYAAVRAAVGAGVDPPCCRLKGCPSYGLCAGELAG